MTSSKPYLRKKAVLIMYKVFLKFPEALRPAFPRLKEKLEDPDPGWVASVNYKGCSFPCLLYSKTLRALKRALLKLTFLSQNIAFL